MVVAVCAYRVENVEKNFRHNISQLRDDEYVVLLDRPHSAQAEAVAEKVRAEGGSMRVLGANNGLSASRNTILRERPHHHILFIDDDVRLDATAVDEVRAAFRAGAHVTGTRLVRPSTLRKLPFFVTSGQFHLIGWHRPQGEIKIWGACMGVDSAFAAAHGLDFDLALSRTGGGLLSGEDTSFIGLMKQYGARERLLGHVAVVHDVDPHRLRLRYLLRRAYWQGRSEVRRKSTVPGFRKELDRHRNAPEARWRSLLLTVVYGGATLLGIAREH
ncbi:glycosyltransferase family 2 protein [Dactylosporangium roseum]|uniref:Glycosyltransferase family 2 protein n=2 Tax=Dactylosporangium roseum TaxID=47989 RepID=A0ABY5ZEM5_9ACTN|nr:glycosyltransferase family 2 protein [Dactylosporangium roseum]